jgi:hypothetical protein
VPNNVRYASNSDRILRRSEMTRCANTLVPSHGLSDISENDAGIEQLQLQVGANGTFQEFNDAVAPLGRICYFEQSMPKWVPKPFSPARGLNGYKIQIKEIFSRIPDLFDAYHKTFGARPKTWPMTLYFPNAFGELAHLRIDDPELFTDRDSVARMVQKWRAEYPFLNQWNFIEAALAWNHSVLNFNNIDKEGQDGPATAIKPINTLAQAGVPIRSCGE